MVGNLKKNAQSKFKSIQIVISRLPLLHTAQSTVTFYTKYFDVIFMLTTFLSYFVRI